MSLLLAASFSCSGVSEKLGGKRRSFSSNGTYCPSAPLGLFVASLLCSLVSACPSGEREWLLLTIIKRIQISKTPYFGALGEVNDVVGTPSDRITSNSTFPPSDFRRFECSSGSL